MKHRTSTSRVSELCHLRIGHLRLYSPDGTRFRLFAACNHAACNHYYRSPLARHVFLTALPAKLDPARAGAYPTYPPSVGDDNTAKSDGSNPRRRPRPGA